MMEKPYIHPSAIVETHSIGKNTYVWAFTHVMSDVFIGKNCNIGGHCFIEKGVSIGDNTTIKNGNMIWEGIAIEKGVFIGPQVVFTNDQYPRSPRLFQKFDKYVKKENWLQKTTVKKGASIGGGAVILPGIMIGEYALIAAAAVVTKDVLPYSLVMGSPAKFKCCVCRCGKPIIWHNSLASSCNHCRLYFKFCHEHENKLQISSF